MYNYENGEVREILAWNPDELQWWITGFNPNTVGQADVKKQVTIGSVDLSRFADSEEKNEIYESLKNNMLADSFKKQFTIFDDNNETMWLMWYGESKE